MDLIYEFLEIPQIPSFLHTIGIALLTILIPISIAMFTGDREYIELDRNVILDEIFQPKLFLVVLGLIFLPILFWHISELEVKIIELILWIIGTSLMIIILKNSYSWIKGNRYNYRINYLSNLKNDKDLAESMRSVWQKGGMDIKSEIDFSKIFSIKIDQNIKINYKLTSGLLKDFYNFMNYRSVVSLVVTEDLFPKILKWHFEIWQKEYELSGKKDKLDERSNYSEISRILNDIFNNIEERSLKERMAYSFFEHFKKHVKDCKKVLLKDANKQDYFRRFINSLFTIFYQVFFKNIAKSPEKHDIWEFCFPEEWEITKNNLENKENIISKVSLNEFLQWAQRRIWQVKEDFDRDLDEVSRNLFPEVDPILWAMLLIFIFSPHVANRMKSIIERSWNFGSIGRVRIYSGDIANSKEESRRKMNEAMQLAEEVETKNTFELAFQLFKEQFSKDNLEKYIKSLKALGPEYKEDPEKEKKRLNFLDTFERMLEFLDSQEKM